MLGKYRKGRWIQTNMKMAQKKIGEKKGKTLTEKWRDLWTKGTDKHMET